MLEVYLNIIEWGPGIYGIHEAAHYYFDKEPSALTLEECIYLSSIIPNPKAFRYSFDKEGMLRERLAGYFKLVAGRLRGKEIITQEQLDSLTFNVTLAGPARELVVPQDSIPADSTAIFEETVLPELP
jgi:membrane peptidoglycan carboxypeptidase